MSEPVTGVRRLLAWPRAYELLQIALGSNASHRRFVREYVRPRPGLRLLDVGCGPGHILRALPADIRYVGLDASPEYVAAARETWGRRAEFEQMTVEDAELGERRFDVVLAMGLLHHLDDGACAKLFALAGAVLDSGGRFVAIDPAYVPGQNRVARWLIDRDRGAYVRDADRYPQLARPSFGTVTASTRGDLLRVPYTHAVLQCLDPLPAAAAVTVRPTSG